MTQSNSVVGYKVFNSNMKCRDYQFAIGGTYKINGELKICENGFHFCEKLADCFNYYSFNSDNKVAVIHAIGDIYEKGDKCATSEIVIVKELTWLEVLELVNIGKNCTGYKNTGDLNTGNKNTGNQNTGYKNTGYKNTGNWNTGNRNTGDQNTGNWNTVDRESGALNTIQSEYINVFNKPCLRVLFDAYEMPSFMFFDVVSDEDVCIKIDYKTAFIDSWNSADKIDRMRIKDCPNFDADVFLEISGIDVRLY